jgi:hypothetical protein
MAITAAMAAVLTMVFTQTASATSQWARKYGMSCTTCHTAFPRLTYYGERFMWNGYQDPDSEELDGATKGKKTINDNLAIDRVSNLLGFRLNLDIARWDSNAVTDAGKKEDAVTIGNANWIQFFVAGSITKNISFFTEMEFKDTSLHVSWWKVGFHNLFDTTLANVIVGNLPTREYGAYPNRLRILGTVKGDIFAVKSSGGAAAGGIIDEKGQNTSSSRPGIQYYAYKGPVVAWTGVSTGDSGTSGKLGHDQNQDLHYWGGLRLGLPESMESAFEGSAVSVWAYKGMDTRDFDGVAAPTQENDYTRYSVEGTVRYKDFEVMAVYLMGKDDNWDLATGMDVDYNGVSIVAGYMTTLRSGKNLHYALQYDKVMSDDVASLEKEYITPAISYFPVENVRIGLYGRIDTEHSGDLADHSAFVNVRTMF